MLLQDALFAASGSSAILMANLLVSLILQAGAGAAVLPERSVFFADAWAAFAPDGDEGGDCGRAEACLWETRRGDPWSGASALAHVALARPRSAAAVVAARDAAVRRGCLLYTSAAADE